MKTWRQMERLVDMGLTKHIGMSNMTIPKLEAVLPLCRIQPAAIEMELHPCFQQQELFDYCNAHNIQVVGFCPIGSPERPERDKTPEDIADIELPEMKADRRGTRRASGSDLHQVGSTERTDPDPLLTEREELYHEPEVRDRRSSYRRGDGGHQISGKKQPSDQGTGIPVAGRQ